MTKKTPNTNTTSVNHQAMTLWREWVAAKRGVGLAIDGQNEQQAILRWEQAEKAIIALADATPASAIVKLAVRLDFETACMGGTYDNEFAVHSAYKELRAITGLDPIAELNRA
jgi:hypothetical protein